VALELTITEHHRVDPASLRVQFWLWRRHCCDRKNVCGLV